jgi:siroheme synthase-like protein
MTPNTAPLYPLFLKLHDRPCLVVGAGPVAAQKARDLLACGAVLRVVSPAVDRAWQPLLTAHAERITLVNRRFEPGDTLGHVLIFAATGDAAADESVFEDARRNGLLANIVDVPHLCHFYAGSTVRRGEVTVAVSTAGASPSLAILLRERIEAALPEGLATLVAALRDARPAILGRWPVYRERAEAMKERVDAALRRLDAGHEPGLVSGDLVREVAPPPPASNLDEVA